MNEYGYGNYGIRPTAKLEDQQVEFGGNTEGRVRDIGLAFDLAYLINSEKSLAKTAMAAMQKATTAKTEAERKLEVFKDQVREVAIRVADEQNWCRDGLNGVLEELELPEHNPRKYVEFKIRLLVEGQNADDEDDAEQAARDYLENVVVYDEDVTIEEIDHRRTWDKTDD